MNTTCPSCGAMLRVPDGAMGKQSKCSECNWAFVLPVECSVGEQVPGAGAPSPVSLPPQPAAPRGSPALARISLSRLCLACGYQGYMQKKSPTWVIICAIVFFPFGLFLLFIKNYKCPQCGTFQD